MKKEFALKKIIPTLLIIAVLATGFFGVFGVGVANAVVIERQDIVKIEKEYQKIINDPNSTDEAKKKAKEERDRNIHISNFLLDIGSMGLTSGRGDECLTWFHLNVSICVKRILANVGEAVLEFFGFILGVSGKLLNVVVKKTVLQMGVGVKEIGAIEEGWKVFRDLSNILIIFALLMIGIATILRSEQYGAKKLLALLIAVALLINFSLFFTQVVIDSSNLLALRFYNKVENIEKAKGGWTTAGWSGFGDSYMQAFKLSTLYKVGDFSDIVQRQLNSTNIFLVTIFGSILFIVAAFTLLAGAFLLISRYVFLIFLMILSPVAFIAYVLPQTSGYAKQWMTMLFRYAFFAPVYFLLTWFVIKVINSPAFANSIGIGAKGDNSFSKITDINTFDGAVALVLNFIIIIFFLIAALLLANQMGIKGSATVMKWGASLRKWGQGVVGGATFGMGGRILRNTAGRGASKMADSGRFKKFAAKSGIAGFAGRAALRATRGVAGTSFDARNTSVVDAAGLGKAGGKGGYEAKLKAQVKNREDFSKSLGEDSLEEKLHKEKLARDFDEKNDNFNEVVRKEKSHKEKMIENKEKLGRVFNNAQEKEKKITIKLEQAKLQGTKDNLKKELDAIIKEKEDAEAMLDRSEKEGFNNLEDIAKEKKLAEALKNDAEKAKKAFKPGIDRQEQYATSLSKDKILGIPFLKVPRKGKEASVKIRKNIKDFPEKKILNEIAKQIKANDSSVNEGGAGKSKEKSEDESGATT